MYGVQPHDPLCFWRYRCLCLRSEPWPATFQRGARRRQVRCLPFARCELVRFQIETFEAMKGRIP
jgi:hypothetical protein